MTPTPLPPDDKPSLVPRLTRAAQATAIHQPITRACRAAVTATAPAKRIPAKRILATRIPATRIPPAHVATARRSRKQSARARPSTAHEPPGRGPAATPSAPGHPFQGPAKPLRRRPRIGPSPLQPGRCEGKGARGAPSAEPERRLPAMNTKEQSRSRHPPWPRALGDPPRPLRPPRARASPVIGRPPPTAAPRAGPASPAKPDRLARQSPRRGPENVPEQHTRGHLRSPGLRLNPHA